MKRYRWYASRYDAWSGEGFYRRGREVAIEALGLTSGSRVLDIGCGTGLNFPLLHERVGDTGAIVGLDLSPDMLEIARQKIAAASWPGVRVVAGDAQAPPAEVGDGFDAALFTYSLSLMPRWREAWAAARSRVRPGGTIAVVDMRLPDAFWARPAAQLACWVGGSDVRAHPWRAVEQDCSEVRSWSLGGGHLEIRVGVV